MPQKVCAIITLILSIVIFADAGHIKRGKVKKPEVDVTNAIKSVY